MFGPEICHRDLFPFGDSFFPGDLLPFIQEGAGQTTSFFSTEAFGFFFPLLGREPG